MPDTTITPEDRAEIYANLRMYAWCLDRADGEGVAATFTHDGIVESSATRSWQNPGGISDFVANAAQMVGFSGRQHHVQPLLVEKTDDGYLVTSYWMVLTEHAGSVPFLVYNGWYRDTCVKEDGQWRFKKRIISRWDLDTAPIIQHVV